MKCMALFKSQICSKLRPQALSHDTLITDDPGEFMLRLGTDRYYMLAVEYDMLTHELRSALKRRPKCVQLHVVTQGLDFDTFHGVCDIGGNEIYSLDEFCNKPTEMLNQLIEKSCQDFYDELFFLLYQAIHSTDASLTGRLLPMLRLWDEEPMVFCLIRLASEFRDGAMELISRKGLLCVRMDAPDELFLALPQGGDVRKKLELLLKEIARECPESNAVVGVSTVLSESEGMCEKVDETRQALMQRFYRDERVCFYAPDCFTVKNDYVRLIALEKQLSNAILSCFEMPHLMSITADYINYFSDMMLLPPMVYDSVYRFLNSLDRVFKYIDPLCTINSDMIRPDDISACQTLGELHDMLKKLFKGYVEMSVHDEGESAVSVPRLKNYLSENMAQELSLDSIAREFYVDKFLLCKSFKQQTGMGLWDYLTKVRIERAADLLINTKQKVHVIAQQVGYQDSGYFSTVFRKVYGVTPKAFRERGGAVSD